MKVSEKAYIAGMLDGDGSISIVKYTAKSTGIKDRLYLRVSIKQNAKGLDILNWMKNTSGHGNVSLAGKQPYKGVTYLVHQWQVTDAQAKKLLLKIIPFVILKKKQARIGIAFAVVKTWSHEHGSRKDAKSQEVLYTFYECCRNSIMFLNASPTETEREGSELTPEEIWELAKKITGHVPDFEEAA